MISWAKPVAAPRTMTTPSRCSPCIGLQSFPVPGVARGVHQHQRRASSIGVDHHHTHADGDAAVPCHPLHWTTRTGRRLRGCASGNERYVPKGSPRYLRTGKRRCVRVAAQRDGPQRCVRARRGEAPQAGVLLRTSSRVCLGLPGTRGVLPGPGEPPHARSLLSFSGWRP